MERADRPEPRRGLGAPGFSGRDGEGIAALGRLNRLRLSGAELTDANLRELARLKSVTALVLDNCRVTGTGVRELTALTNLTSLDLTDTPVPDAVMTALQAALPKCTIRK